MRDWDENEKRRDKKQGMQEKIGRYMVTGGIAFLAVYLTTVALEIYQIPKCITC